MNDLNVRPENMKFLEENRKLLAIGRIWGGLIEKERQNYKSSLYGTQGRREQWNQSCSIFQTKSPFFGRRVGNLSMYHAVALIGADVVIPD